MKYTKEIIIKKNINTVFEKLTSPKFMPEWQESLDSYEQNEDGKWIYTDSHSGKSMKITENILEKIKPSKFKVEYTTNGIVNIMDNTLTKVDETTTKWTSYNEFKFTSLMMKVIGLFFGGSFRNQTEKDMNSFKNTVERIGN